MAEARRLGAVLASHDDTTEAHVAASVRHGARIAEFPTSATAAAASHARGHRGDDGRAEPFARRLALRQRRDRRPGRGGPARHPLLGLCAREPLMGAVRLGIEAGDLAAGFRARHRRARRAPPGWPTAAASRPASAPTSPGCAWSRTCPSPAASGSAACASPDPHGANEAFGRDGRSPGRKESPMPKMIFVNLPVADLDARWPSTSPSVSRTTRTSPTRRPRAWSGARRST